MRKVNTWYSPEEQEDKQGYVTTHDNNKHLQAVPQDFISRIFLSWSFCVLFFPNQKEQNCAHKTDNSQSNEDSSAIALCGKTNKNYN